jgi:hypothetical protein
MSSYKKLPVEQLKRLAACMVKAEGRLNTAVVVGVGMVLCTKAGRVRLSDLSRLSN